MAMAHSLGELSSALTATRPQNFVSPHSELASFKFSPFFTLSARPRSSCKWTLCVMCSAAGGRRPAGGKRPRRPHIWKSRHRRGSINKADKLLDSLDSVSNVKEEVYGVLDSFVAWEVDFPLISVKKALTTLEREKNWPRVIQIIKWMLGKGQGKSLSTYHLLLKAFSEEGRTEEAQDLFKRVFSRNFECTPLKLFSEIMKMYERHEMYEDILEVFADMEELNVRLDTRLSEIVARTYEKIGDMERAYRVKLKYAPPKFRWRKISGRTFKFRNEDRDVAVSRWTKGEIFNDGENDLAVSKWTGEGNPDDQRVQNETDRFDEDRMVANEDSRDYESADEDSRDYESVDDEELEVDEDENEHNDRANEVYYHHIQARNEMYV